MAETYGNQLVLLKELMKERNIDEESVNYIFEEMLKEFIRVDSDLPIGVNALIISENEGGGLLLCKRGKLAFCGGTYALPWGHLQKSETLEEGVARECLEELGIEVNPDDVQIISMGETIDGDKGKHYLQVGGIVKIWKGEMKIMEPQKMEEFRFFPLDNLPENLFFGTKVNIDLLLKNIFYDKSCNYYK